MEGLPCHTFPTDDGGVDMKCPTEIAITDRREAELAKNGLMPLLHRKGTDLGEVFIGAAIAAEAAGVSESRCDGQREPCRRGLPRICSPRAAFAHYLKCISARPGGDVQGTCGDLEKYLNTWISQYVEPDPTCAGQ